MVEGEEVDGIAMPKMPAADSYQMTNLTAIMGANSGDGFFRVKGKGILMFMPTFCRILKNFSLKFLIISQKFCLI